MMKYRFIVPERNTYNTNDNNTIMNDIVSIDLFINEKNKKIEDIIIGEMISSSKSYISSRNRGITTSSLAEGDYHQSTNQFDYIYKNTIDSKINQGHYPITDLNDPYSSSIIKEEVLDYILNLINNDENFDFTVELNGITYDLSDLNIEYFILDKVEFDKYFNINNDITNYKLNELEVIYKKEATTVINTYKSLLLQLKENAKSYNINHDQESKSKFACSLSKIYEFWKFKMEVLVNHNVRDIYLSNNIEKIAYFSIEKELEKLTYVSKKYSIISNYLKYDFGKTFIKRVLDSAIYFYFKSKEEISNNTGVFKVYNLRRVINAHMIFIENKINPMISIYIELKNILDPNFKIMDGFIFEDFDEEMAKVYLSNSSMSNGYHFHNDNLDNDYSLCLRFIPTIALKEKSLTKDTNKDNNTFHFSNNTLYNYNTNIFNRGSTLNYNYRDNLYKRTEVRIEYFNIKTIMNNEKFDSKYKSLCKNIISNLLKSTKDYLDNMETFEDLELTRVFRLSIDYKRILNKLYLNRHFNYNSEHNNNIQGINKMTVIQFDRASRLEKLGYNNLVEMYTRVHRDYFLDFIHNYLKKHKKTHVTSNILNKLDDMFKFINIIFEKESYSNSEIDNEDQYFTESFIKIANIFSVFKKMMLFNSDANIYNKIKKFPKSFDFKDKSLYNNILLYKILSSNNSLKYKSKIEELNKALGIETVKKDQYSYMSENYRLGFYNKNLLKISSMTNFGITPILTSNFPLTYNPINKKDMYFSNTNKEFKDEKILDFYLLRYIKSSKIKSWVNSEIRVLENVPKEFFNVSRKRLEGDPDGDYQNINCFNVQLEQPMNTELVGDLFIEDTED